jgi:hypothetical protein
MSLGLSDSISWFRWFIGSVSIAAMCWEFEVFIYIECKAFKCFFVMADIIITFYIYWHIYLLDIGVYFCILWHYARINYM